MRIEDGVSPECAEVEGTSFHLGIGEIIGIVPIVRYERLIISVRIGINKNVYLILFT